MACNTDHDPRSPAARARVLPLDPAALHLHRVGLVMNRDEGGQVIQLQQGDNFDSDTSISPPAAWSVMNPPRRCDPHRQEALRVEAAEARTVGAALSCAAVLLRYA